MRYGLTELTSVTAVRVGVVRSTSSRTARSAASKLPSTATTLRAGGLCLEQLARGDLAFRDDDDDLEPGAAP